MKKKILYLIFLITAGTLAYYGGYHAYIVNRPNVELIQPEALQKAVQIKSTDHDYAREYYVGKIEEDQLMIYKMPEDSLYDSVQLSSLSFYGDEKEQLVNGMVFENLTEVFEFLENSMS